MKVGIDGMELPVEYRFGMKCKLLTIPSSAFKTKTLAQRINCSKQSASEASQDSISNHVNKRFGNMDKLRSMIPVHRVTSDNINHRWSNWTKVFNSPLCIISGTELEESLPKCFINSQLMQF